MTKDNSLIINNLKYLIDARCKIEIRYPFVKGYNDGECEGIARLLSPMPCIEKVKVLKYHPFAASRYLALGMENTLPEDITEDSDIDEALRILRGYGLPAVR